MRSRNAPARSLPALGAALLIAANALAQPVPASAPVANSSSAQKPRAAPGALLAPAERAIHVVSGTIGALRQLDPQGWSAELAVERVCSGNARPGMKLRIAWEELAPSFAVRFANGERVLVALERLPNGSLWMARFPTRKAVAVAERGAAFLRNPDAASLAALSRYLSLPARQRGGSAGIEALANIARDASEQVAAEALVRLGALPELSRALTPAARGSLGATLADPDRPELVRLAALALIGARKLNVFEAEVRAVANLDSALGSVAVKTLAEIGALSPAEIGRYVNARDPARRAAVLSGAPRAHAASRLTALARNDPAGSVRAAALEALVRNEGVHATEVAVDALFDADADVQAAALRALPAFPKESAQLLRTRAFGARARDTEATKPVLAGLSLLGRDGAAVLRELERDHPNEEIRRLAQFLLGRTPEH